MSIKNKINHIINKFQYRIGIKYLIFLFAYLLILGIILIIIFTQIKGKEKIYALPAFIIGYDRLFSIIRKSFNYGIGRLNDKRETENIIKNSKQHIFFAKFIISIFYFWQENWQQMRKQNIYWTNWKSIEKDFQAILNNDCQTLKQKYVLDSKFISFSNQVEKSYYFKNFIQYETKIKQLAKKKDYAEAKKTFIELEAEILMVKKIFQMIFMWITSINNKLTTFQLQREQTTTYFNFVNITLKKLLLNNFLEIGLTSIEKKYEKFA